MVDTYNNNSYRRELEKSRNSHYSSSNNPSFSSLLLDAVYRSIGNGDEEIETNYPKPMRRKKQTYTPDAACGGGFKTQEPVANFQRACMIDKWMDNKAAEKTGNPQKRKSSKDRETSSSSSSDFSCGGGHFFSSSDAESTFPVQRPKPVRTGGSGFDKENLGKGNRDFGYNRREKRDFTDQLEQKPNHESGFLKTKSRALKIYGDLKKVKQPISPGGKLAGFLNSLFTNGNLKRPKSTANCGDDSPSVKSANTSTCSSASSFSRSCLSKTPSSAGKSSNSAKRSVRFFPVSVIVDEDCQPCGHKSLQEETNYHYTLNNGDYKKENSNSELTSCKNSSIRNEINEELMVHILEKNRRLEEVERDLLRNYQKKIQAFHPEFDDEEDDDDAASYASSDLFELDNLSAIGMEKYREELPVYETTRIDTNRSIASGMNIVIPKM